MARLLASGKISEEVWDDLWSEWQDRRNQASRALETLSLDHDTHVDNLEVALEIIARIGTLYNGLQRGDQKELLRHVVERVVVNPEGKIHLELRAPFAYLKELTDEIRILEARQGEQCKKQQRSDKKGGEGDTPPPRAVNVRINSYQAGEVGFELLRVVAFLRVISIRWNGSRNRLC